MPRQRLAFWVRAVLPGRGGMSGAMQVPVYFHTVTIAGQTPGQPIDKKCGGFDKINAAKSARKGGRFRRIKGATGHSVNFETKERPSRNYGVPHPMPAGLPCPADSKIARTV